MITLYADKETARVAAGLRSRKLPPDIQGKAFRLLREMGRVAHWNDLRFPPSNRLHALGGDRAGQSANWINQQWRIVFSPTTDGYMSNVEITDYH